MAESRSPTPSKTEEQAGALAMNKSRGKSKFFTSSEMIAIKKCRGKRELSRVMKEIEKSRGKSEFLKLKEKYRNSMKRKAFRRKWRLSDGFDVGTPPLGLEGGFLVFGRCRIDSWRIDTCFKCVDFAIKSENNDKNSNLELVKIVKYHTDAEPLGEMCYLTFIAKGEEGREDVYEAKVFIPKKEEKEEKVVDFVYEDYERAREITVVIFRKKPSEYQQSKGAEQEHGCGKKKEGRSCDGGSKEEHRPPAPSENKENPFPCSDALLEKQVDAPATEESYRWKNPIVFPEGPSFSAPCKAVKDPVLDALLEKLADAAPPMDESYRRLLGIGGEYEEFCRRWDMSDGLDAGDKLFGMMQGLKIIIEDNVNRFRIDTCFKCLDFAIKSENNDKNSNLEFVQILKYNIQFESRGEMYYLTFKAKDKEGGKDFYQAKVFNPKKDGEEGEGRREMKVVIFRKKRQKKPRFGLGYLWNSPIWWIEAWLR